MSKKIENLVESARRVLSKPDPEKITVNGHAVTGLSGVSVSIASPPELLRIDIKK